MEREQANRKVIYLRLCSVLDREEIKEKCLRIMAPLSRGYEASTTASTATKKNIWATLSDTSNPITHPTRSQGGRFLSLSLSLSIIKYLKYLFLI